MTDADLRALAVKLLKHYAADCDPAVEEIIASRPLDRAPAKVVPLITKEQRELLNMLGGGWADIHEGKTVALIAQGCGGCSGGDGDGDGDDGDGDDDDGGAEGGPAEGGPEGGDAPAGSPDGVTDANINDSGLGGPPSGPGGGPGGGVAQGGDPADALNEAMGWNAPATSEDPGLTSLSVSGQLSSEMQDALDALNNAPEAALEAAPAAPDAAPEAAPEAPTSDILGSIGRGLGELFGISSANAAPANSGQAAVVDAAREAAAKGELSQFMSDPFNAVNVPAAFNAGLQATDAAARNAANPYGSLAMSPDQAKQAELAGSLAPIGASPAAAPFVSNPYGSLTMSPDQAKQVELAGSFVPFGASLAAAAPSVSNPYGSLAMSPDQAKEAEARGDLSHIGSTPTTSTPSNNVSLGYTAPSTAYALGETPQVAMNPWSSLDQTAPAPSTPVAQAPALGPAVDVPTLNTINLSPAAPPAPDQPTAMSATSYGKAPSYTGIDLVDSKINSMINNPVQTAINAGVSLVPGLGLVNTASGLLGGPTVGSALTGLKGAEPGSTPDSSGADNGSGSGSGNLYIPTMAPAAYAPVTTTAPATTAPATTTITPTQDAALRTYLGAASNPYAYGAGAERTYYSAKGGMFDADKYFADGGLVAPAQPPATSTAPPYPTMAFTDGGGAVGNIAQPPGMVASDAFGSDAAHASPMAPSIAASVPTVQPALQTLASRNANASPAPSPIAQNPNVDYSFGMSPLSQL